MKAKPDKHHHHHHQKTHEDKQEDRRLGNPAGGGVDEQQEKISQVKVVVSILHGVPYRNGKGSLYKKENIWERGRLGRTQLPNFPILLTGHSPFSLCPLIHHLPCPKHQRKSWLFIYWCPTCFPNALRQWSTRGKSDFTVKNSSQGEFSISLARQCRATRMWCWCCQSCLHLAVSFCYIPEKGISCPQLCPGSF